MRCLVIHIERRYRYNDSFIGSFQSVDKPGSHNSFTICYVPTIHSISAGMRKVKRMEYELTILIQYKLSTWCIDFEVSYKIAFKIKDKDYSS